MASLGGPNIVTSGLVLSLDAANVKSYPGSGTTWRDLSGNNNTGTLTNGPTFSNSGLGSIVFDGVDDYVDLISNYKTITISGTVEIGLRFNGLNDYKHVWVFDKTDAPEIRLSTNPTTGTFGFAVYDGGSYKFQSYPITPTMYQNTWIYVQVYWGNNNYGVLYNGVVLSSSTSGGAITNTGPATTSRLGNYPKAGGSQFNGSISSFRIYNRVLTQGEMQQNYNATKSRFNL